MADRHGSRSWARWRRWLYPGGLLILGIVVWILVPHPLVRGVVIGALSTLALLVVALLLWIRFVQKRLGGDDLDPPPIPTGSWDYALEVKDLDGRDVAFEQFRGRVLVLNFWATWCSPCIAEMPSLERLRDRTRDFGVAFACVTRETLDVVEPFWSERGFDLPVYLLEDDVPEVFEARAIPATFVLDRTGRVQLRHFGAAAWDHERVVAFVRGLAATPEA